MNGSEIRNAKEGAEQVLTGMLFHALYVPPGGTQFDRSVLSEPTLRAYVENWHRPGDECFIAFDLATSEPVGAIWIRLFSTDNPGYGFVDENTPELSMAVVPGRRGQGIGTELLRKMLEYLDRRCAAVSLSVSSENPARRLYLRSGFEVVGSDTGSLIMLRQPSAFGG